MNYPPHVNTLLDDLKQLKRSRVQQHVREHGQIPNWNPRNVKNMCMFFSGPGSLSPIEEILVELNYPLFKEIYTPNRLLFEHSPRIKLCSGSPRRSVNQIHEADTALKNALLATNILSLDLLKIVYSFAQNYEQVFYTVNAESVPNNELNIVQNLFTLVITWPGHKWLQDESRLDFYRSCSSLCILKIAKDWQGYVHEDAFLQFTKIDQVILDQVSLLEWQKNEIRFLCAEKCVETSVWKPYVFRVKFLNSTRTCVIIK